MSTAPRDRVVVSSGQGPMLLHAPLHLAGYDLPLVKLQRFRQLHSRPRTPIDHRSNPWQ
jgi:transketolase